MTYQKIPINFFLKERESRIKPNEANKMKLKRLNKIDFSGQIHLSNKTTNTDMIIVKNGDLVISGINVEKGAIAVYQGKEDILATIHYSAYIFDKNKIDTEYLKLFLKSAEFKKAINSQIRGGIKTELKASKFLSLEINLPDLKTQIEIKNLLSEKIKQIDNYSNFQDQTLSLISQLRQQILQEAVQGKLVPQNPNDEPASELLKKIKAEKDKLIKEGKIKKDKPLFPISEEEIPYELLKGWEWVRFNDLAFITKLAGFEYTKYIYPNLNESKEVPLIKGGNIYDSEMDYNCKDYISLSLSKRLYRSALTKKCLLTPFVGSLGNVAVFNNSKRFHLGSNVAKIEIFNNESLKLLEEYVYIFLKSNSGKEQLIKEKKSTAQESISMANIRNCLFPLPPLPEQIRIVEKVDKLMAYCDELEKQVKENQKNAENLMNAVLKESFEK